MFDSAIFQNLCAHIADIKGRIDMDATYLVHFHCHFLNEDSQMLINQAPSSYRKNLILKRALSERLSEEVDANEKMNIYRWIIQDWGGIRSFTRYDQIPVFLEQLDNNRLDGVFTSIPSLSKVASFVRPDRYFILDSRVSLALNWLLFVSGERTLFFPFMSSRSPRVRNAQELLSRRIAEYGGQKMGIGNGYQSYCELIQEIYPIVFSDDVDFEPCKVEMLLFQAKDLIVEGILQAFPDEPARTTDNNISENITLEVFEGGKTIRIVNNKKTLPHNDATRVYVVFDGLQYEARLGTYQRSDTLRGKDTIARLIRENHIGVGSNLQCVFYRRDDGSHEYRIV